MNSAFIDTVWTPLSNGVKVFLKMIILTVMLIVIDLNLRHKIKRLKIR